MNKAVFLDRDGTLNFDVGYLSKIEDIYIFEGVVESLKKLKDSGYLNIIITNQSGVARGLFTLSNLKTIHEKFLNLLSYEGECLIDDIFFSPYHKDGTIEEFKKESICRKPDTGMIDKAVSKYDIDLSKSFFIGDSLVDMQCAVNAGLKKILVKTGYGIKTFKDIKDSGLKVEYVAQNFKEAADYILKNPLWVISSN